MSFRGRRLALLSALLGVALVSGCGGGGGKSNGIDKLSASDALTKVKAATADVHSVHVKGQINQSSQSITLDVSVGEKAASGTINIGGGTMDLRLVDGVTYFRGDSKVFAAFGANGAQASLAAGRWIKATGSTGPAASFATFLDLKTLFSQLLTPQGTISTGGTATVNGHKALILIDSSSEGGKLYVATTGAALPLRIERSASNGGRIDFLDYNAGVSVSAPSGAVDLSQLTGG
jgi:hypothetical protein